ncbi:hypothetical protein PVAND_008031 [Polypedilum vanderplanki]|uniref:Uncharacterized protein n=1 Tax=Polypedilum vanderplanki TaxID=319348 RepID=A0A9J6C994_POLVA|nr:hypothetical protein PVAND_008031 [Polypedilum vanderplanki]
MCQRSYCYRSQLPARATRLLNRRLQNTNSSSPINGSESPRSLDSMHSRTSARASLREHLKQRQQQNIQSQLINSSSEDLLADKSLRNSMLQDVSTFKKQLVQLRRILQESDTLNPFEINGQIFSHLNGSGSNGVLCENEKEMPSNDKEKTDDEKNVLANQQLMLLEDQRQELADLRRQVVFLQSQMDDKDRLIRQQQNKLDELRMDNMRLLNDKPSVQNLNSNITETANCATQTERLRPVSMGSSQDFNSQQEPHKSQKNDSKQIPTITIKPSPQRSKTQISSVYTKLSSIKPTLSPSNRNSSILTTPSSKPMKSTKIEHPKTTPLRMQNAANVMRNTNDLKTPLRRSIPQLVKTPNSNIIHGSTKNSIKLQKQTIAATSSHSMKVHRTEDSNGNSATSSLSTSSSNSSINDKNPNSNNSNHSDCNGIGFLAQQLNEIYSRGLLE